MDKDLMDTQRVRRVAKTRARAAVPEDFGAFDRLRMAPRDFRAIEGWGWGDQKTRRMVYLPRLFNHSNTCKQTVVNDCLCDSTMMDCLFVYTNKQTSITQTMFVC